ncbi:MAG: bifunctional DNA-formamidopyrimidine glycosylase/DNA-(apurinic or apyrimidinic site) lyase [Thermodesulfobacteriota bacterium]
MPELPEVEVIRRGLAPHVVGRRVTGVHFSTKKLRLPVERGRMRRTLPGAGIAGVGRRGKYLLLETDTGAVLVVHLGMSGRLGLFAATAPVATHDHFRLSLDDGMEIRFNDPRRFGCLQLAADREQCDALFAELGPEPLEEEFSGIYLAARAAGRSQPVKSFLMDSRTVVGIGNIYASEILHAACIRPETAIGTVTAAGWRRLAEESKKVLTEAIRQGGTTISDYVNASGEPGYFQNVLQVYGRGGEPCHRCGSRIERTVMAGRATYFCRRCQR